MSEAGPARKGWARSWAQAELDRGDPVLAGEALGLAAAEQARDPLAAQRVALHWLHLGRAAEAVPWLRRVKRLAPDSAEAHFALGHALALRGNDLPAELAADEELADALLRIPLFASDPATLRAVPMSGGNRNQVYRVTAGDRDYVLRLGRIRTRWQAYWEERHNMEAAHAHGCAPPCFFLDIADGTLVSPFVDGVRTPRDLSRPDFLRRAGALLARLHRGPAFRGEHDPFPALDWRLERIAGRDFPIIRDLAALMEWSEGVRRRFLADAPPKAPCHNDPVAANFIDTPGGLVMVDWETAGMADPEWEVGLLLGRIPDRDGLRETFLAAAYGAADHPRAKRAHMAAILSRYIEMVEGLQMVALSPEEEGWDRHAVHAADFLRARMTEGGSTGRKKRASKKA